KYISLLTTLLYSSVTMAPSVILPQPITAEVPDFKSLSLKSAPTSVIEVEEPSTPTGNKHNYVPGEQPNQNDADETYPWAHLRPSFPDVKWEPLQEIPYEDKGLLGHPQFKNLLDAAEDVFDYTPKLGTEIVGVSLKTLTDAQKNDLARLIAYRGVVFFRNQSDWTVDDQLELGRYWGKLHKHATTAMPREEGRDEIHVVYADDRSVDQSALFTPG